MLQLAQRLLSSQRVRLERIDAPSGVLALNVLWFSLYVASRRFPDTFAVPAPAFFAERSRQMVSIVAASIGVALLAELATWLDLRLYRRVQTIDVDRRLALLLLVPAAVAVSCVALARSLGDPFILCVVGAAALWLACRALGTFLFVALDVSISALLDSFRDRLRVLVIALLALASLAAFELAPRIIAIMKSDGRSPWVDALGHEVGEIPALQPFAHNTLLLLAAIVGLTALPLVTSATGKFVAFVMEGINPIIGALDAVTAGRRDVRVEVRGSAEFARLAQRFNRMVEQLALAERMEHAFGMYTSAQLFDRIRAQHGEATMPTTTRWASVMFVDIRGFTEISERLPPESVVTLLNTFFAACVEVVERHEGFLNKFIGDSLMIVFNGPIDQPDHAERAVKCALAMHAAVARLNEVGAFSSVGALRIGAGIATGTMISGNIGGPRQMEYTVIGDVVNTAARLCSIAAGAETLVTQATAGALPATLPVRMLEPVTLKGKREAIAVARVEDIDADDHSKAGEEERRQETAALRPS